MFGKPLRLALALALLALGANLPGVSPGLLRGLALGALAAKYASDAWLIRAINGAFPRPSELPLLLLKDLGMWGVWLLGALKRHVNWRGHVLRIGPGSRLHPTRPALSREPAVARA